MEELEMELRGLKAQSLRAHGISWDRSQEMVTRKNSYNYAF